ENWPAYFHAIDAAAEELHKQLAAGEDLAVGLRAWLQKNHGIVVRTLPVHAMPNLRRRYDRHSMRLFLSERLSQPDQLREMA
ncbi:ImmA/IrrE family metallo-endopeptidase, partial [Xanthomonas translucens]